MIWEEGANKSKYPKSKPLFRRGMEVRKEGSLPPDQENKPQKNQGVLPFKPAATQKKGGDSPRPGHQLVKYSCRKGAWGKNRAQMKKEGGEIARTTQPRE